MSVSDNHRDPRDLTALPVKWYAVGDASWFYLDSINPPEPPKPSPFTPESYRAMQERR